MLTPLLAPPLCWSCARTAPPGLALCHDCSRGLRRLPPEPVTLAGVPCFAPVAYEGPARDLVRALKFRAALAVAGAMAAAIVAGAPPGFLAGAALVPVPLSRRRERRRGFNQAHALSLALARRTGAEVVPCLRRRAGHGTQVGRDRSERSRALRGSMTASEAPADAVIVDDVVTTGATLAAAAEALRCAGCTGIRAVAYARTGGR
ncbi:MAG: ComF family protein [Thermoleophilaceae bacterium]|nr:ComF family protein [Thermoleophilaceae bacterium]